MYVCGVEGWCVCVCVVSGCGVGGATLPDGRREQSVCATTCLNWGIANGFNFEIGLDLR